MSIARNNDPQQRIIIDKKNLADWSLGELPLALPDDLAKQIEDLLAQALEPEFDIPLEWQNGIDDLAVLLDPADESETTATPDGSFADAPSFALTSIDTIAVINLPLPEIASGDLLADSGLANAAPRVSFAETSAQFIEQSASELIFLNYQPLARPDHAGGGNGGGGGKDKPGKGGGKPDKDGDSGGDTGGDPGVLDTYTSGPDDASTGYNIQIDFTGTWTLSLQAAFIDAADLISSFITGDISNVSYNGGIIDDIIITAELSAIDGAGGILGQAGPTGIRSDSKLPALAQMQFDSADADNFNGQGLWDDIIIHEMLHSVGLGTVWDNLGLISGYGTDDPLFTGVFANLAYDELFPNLDASSDFIPIEADGGSGTAYGHWDEAAFGNELMTGYINGSNDLSAMSVASLEDLGYDTTWDASAPGDTGIGTIII